MPLYGVITSSTENAVSRNERAEAYEIEREMDLGFKFSFGELVGGALVDVALRLHLCVVGQPIHLDENNILNE